MRNPISSFILHLSSFVLLIALGNTASAQWIIDGQQVQTLNLNVSDPQAVYTDGSREMDAPLAFSSSLTATSGWFQATLPWDGAHTFFLTDEDEEVLNFSSSGNVGLQIGRMIVRDSGLYQLDEGTQVDMGEHMLSGGWQIDEVLPYPEALINRGYADTRYLRGDTDLTAPLSFSSASTATSGLFRAYYDPEGQVEEFFIIDGDYECVRLGSAVPALMVGGTYYGDGAIVMGQSRIYLEDEIIEGPQWRLDQVMDHDKALINRSYADTRYLNQGSQSGAISFDQSLTATNGALQIYATDNEDHLGYFKSLSFQDGLQFSTAHSAALFFGENSSDGLLVGPSYIMQTGYGPQLDFEAGVLDGVAWTVSQNPVQDQGIVSRGYADARYLKRTEGITTNHTVQAGDVLQIQNGLITAINP